MAKLIDELAKRTMTVAMIRKGKIRARAYSEEIGRKVSTQSSFSACPEGTHGDARKASLRDSR